MVSILLYSVKKVKRVPDMVVNAGNPNTWETEAGGPRVKFSLDLYREFMDSIGYKRSFLKKGKRHSRMLKLLCKL